MRKPSIAPSTPRDITEPPWKRPRGNRMCLERPRKSRSMFPIGEPEASPSALLEGIEKTGTVVTAPREFSLLSSFVFQARLQKFGPAKSGPIPPTEPSVSDCRGSKLNEQRKAGWRLAATERRHVDGALGGVGGRRCDRLHRRRHDHTIDVRRTGAAAQRTDASRPPAPHHSARPGGGAGSGGISRRRGALRRPLRHVP